MKIGESPKLASFSEIKKRIAQLNRMDLKKASVKNLKKRMEILWHGYTQTSRYMRPGPFYRGVPWQELPTLTQQLSYQKDISNVSYGRANLPGFPMFYCSGNPNAIFHELHPKPGAMIAVSRWKSKHDTLICDIGYTSDAFMRLKSSREAPQIVPNDYRHPNEINNTNILVSEYYTNEFIKPVPDDKKYFYKTTAIIAEYFLSVLPAECGIAYPSVAMQANAENFALPPTYVDKHLQIDNVFWYRVDACDASSFTVTPLNFADTFTDGHINWREVPSGQGGPRRISIESGLYVNDKIIVQNELFLSVDRVLLT